MVPFPAAVFFFRLVIFVFVIFFPLHYVGINSCPRCLEELNEANAITAFPENRNADVKKNPFPVPDITTERVSCA